MGAGIKKDTREQGGKSDRRNRSDRRDKRNGATRGTRGTRGTRATGGTGGTGGTRILVFPVLPILLVFPVFPLGRPSRPFFFAPLLVAKVAQKPRTTSLAETRVAKPKTNASQAKRLPSSFFHGFVTLVSRDRQIGRLPADDAKCGF